MSRSWFFLAHHDLLEPMGHCFLPAMVLPQIGGSQRGSYFSKREMSVCCKVLFRSGCCLGGLSGYGTTFSKRSSWGLCWCNWGIHTLFWDVASGFWVLEAPRAGWSSLYGDHGERRLSFPPSKEGLQQNLFSILHYLRATWEFYFCNSLSSLYRFPPVQVSRLVYCSFLLQVSFFAEELLRNSRHILYFLWRICELW